MQQVNTARRQRLWGLAALAIAMIIGLVVAFLYVSPPNERTVSFYTDDAASVRPGDTVRIAGVVVGKVKDLALEPDRVRVRANIDGDAFIGDQSQVQVRMLTVVGGYYVTIIPLGRARLGDHVIPKERVTMPYNLVQALTDTRRITENVAPTPIKESIDQLQQGLRGTNAHSVEAVLNAGNTIADILDRQRGQLSEILRMSDEYIDNLANYRDTLQRYIRRVSIIEQSLILYGKSFSDAIVGIGNVPRLLDPVTDFYFTHREDFLERVRGILGELRTIASRNGLLVRILGRIHDRMERAVDAQTNFVRPELLATDICIPTHGSPC